MIIDKLALFSNDQAITADAASTDIMDLSDIRDLGPGAPIYLVVTITEVFNNLTSMQVDVEVDAGAGFGTPQKLVSASRTLAQLTAGEKIVMAIPPNFVNDGGEQFLRVFYDITGTAPTTGKVHAALVQGYDAAYHYQAESFLGL